MKLKNLLIFTAGVAVGVIADRLFGKAEKPSDDDVWFANAYSMDISHWDNMDELPNALWNAHTVSLGKALEAIDRSKADAQPSDEVFDDWIEEYEDSELEAFRHGVKVDSDSLTDQEVYSDELLIRVFTPDELAEIRAFSDSLDDTQPIRVSEEKR
jgi:hypothetical protein